MRLLVMLILFAGSLSYGQSGFKILKGKKESLSFNSSANLIIIPATVNGTKMNFILDTGSSKSVIFDLTGVDSLNIKKGRVLKYKGLGSEDYFEAYYSPINLIQIGDNIVNKNAEILVMVNKDFSMSKRLGTAVNGIIGTDLFQNLIIEIDYENNRLTAYNPDSNLPRSIRKARYLNMQLKQMKPYISSEIENDNGSIKTNLLLDTGSSDALLLYDLDSTVFNYPKKSFRDYLGYGLTGELYGYRSKVDLLAFDYFKIRRSTVSFISKDDIEEFSLSIDSNGSIGGEILRRFNIILNYSQGKVAFTPNNSFDEGFYYNMAGIQLKLEGADLVVSKSDGRWSSAKDNYKEHDGQVTIQRTTLTYTMIPKVIVAGVNLNSVAYKAGLREGDQIIKLNGKSGVKLTLNTATSYFFKKPYSDLKITYRRGDVDSDIIIPLIPIIE